MVACLRNLRLLTDFWVRAFQDTTLSITLPAVTEVRVLALVSGEGNGRVHCYTSSSCRRVECLRLVAVRTACLPLPVQPLLPCLPAYKHPGFAFLTFSTSTGHWHSEAKPSYSSLIGWDEIWGCKQVRSSGMEPFSRVIRLQMTGGWASQWDREQPVTPAGYPSTAVVSTFPLSSQETSCHSTEISRTVSMNYIFVP